MVGLRHIVTAADVLCLNSGDNTDISERAEVEEICRFPPPQTFFPSLFNRLSLFRATRLSPLLQPAVSSSRCLRGKRLRTEQTGRHRCRIGGATVALLGDEPPGSGLSLFCLRADGRAGRRGKNTGGAW